MKTLILSILFIFAIEGCDNQTKQFEDQLQKTKNSYNELIRTSWNNGYLMGQLAMGETITKSMKQVNGYMTWSTTVTKERFVYDSLQFEKTIK